MGEEKGRGKGVWGISFITLENERIQGDLFTKKIRLTHLKMMIS